MGTAADEKIDSSVISIAYREGGGQIKLGQAVAAFARPG